MRIVFAGTPEFAVPSLHALVAAGHEIVGVLTRADAPVGRKRVLTPSPVAQAAESLGLKVYRTNVLDAAATDWVAALDPDLGAIVAYGGLVRDPLLTLPRLGWINLHFSDLPLWRGAAPVQRALEAGEQTLGVTVFRLVAALDAGAVLTRDTQEFVPGTSAGEALTALATTGTDALVRAVMLLERDPAAGETQQGEPSYAHKLSREDGKLDLTEPGSRVLARWAGMTPEPGAYAFFDDAPIKLLRLAPLRGELIEHVSEISAAPGTVRLVAGSAVLFLNDGALWLQQVQPAGKAAMEGSAWLRGRGGEATLV